MRFVARLNAQTNLRFRGCLTHDKMNGEKKEKRKRKREDEIRRNRNVPAEAAGRNKSKRAFRTKQQSLKGDKGNSGDESRAETRAKTGEGEGSGEEKKQELLCLHGQGAPRRQIG